MTNSKHLNTGDICIGFEEDVLTTDGIGSCVVICLWDPIQKIGGMAHMFQPNIELIGSMRTTSKGGSPDSAVPFLFHRMLELGARHIDIRASLIGAGNMFAGIQEGSSLDIGKGILSSTVLQLRHVGLSVRSQSVGGRLGRSVKFSVDSGEVFVGFTNGEIVLL